jgi:Sel1 repeat-containing protein
VRCGRCGNENSGDNRFCGMCGASLVANEAVPVTASPIITGPVATAPAVSVPRVAAQSVPATRVTPPSFSPSINPSPVINGPSFLGLNKPTDGRSGNDRLRQGSHNLDYLLDDEDDEPRRGWGKLAVVVIALALIGGFGYLRWKQGGFNFVKPAPVARPSQGAPDSAGTAATRDAASPNAASPDTANPNTANPNPPAPDAAAPNPQNPSPAAPDGAASGSTPAPATGGTASSGAESSAQPPPPANATAPPSTPADNPPPAKPEDNAAGDKSKDSDSTENPAAEPAKSGSDLPAAEAKPSAPRTRERKPTPVTSADPTPEAERYLYGRGVRQDCDRGLRLLKPAAAQSNAKAMIALGALYSSGTCTPRDLPTAYRWFALALHKQPDNQPLQDDLQKLWTQMTQPERQLAIKLSQ